MARSEVILVKGQEPVVVEMDATKAAIYDAKDAAYTAALPRKAALAEIARLEATITERRKREAILGNAEAIAEIQGVEDLIAIERAKL